MNDAPTITCGTVNCVTARPAWPRVRTLAIALAVSVSHCSRGAAAVWPRGVCDCGVYFGWPTFPQARGRLNVLSASGNIFPYISAPSSPSRIIAGPHPVGRRDAATRPGSVERREAGPNYRVGGSHRADRRVHRPARVSRAGVQRGALDLNVPTPRSSPNPSTHPPPCEGRVEVYLHCKLYIAIAALQRSLIAEWMAATAGCGSMVRALAAMVINPRWRRR